jgi:MFS transporter, putative metabolite:H+ symporter
VGVRYSLDVSEPTAAPVHPAATQAEPYDAAYQRRLVFFLSVATFFEGYDFLALSQVLPNLRRTFELSESGGGPLLTVVNLGTMLAFFLVRQADRWGRKRILTITIVGYTTLTFLSGLAPNVYVFALLQMAARVFLLAEYAVSLVIVAEESPAEKRGMFVGIIAGASALGAIVCAGITPILLNTPLGWRSVYLVSVIPLLLLAWARRSLRETRRFANTADVHEATAFPLFRLWRSPYRGRMLLVAAIWFLCYLPANNAITFFKEYAVGDLGWTDAQVGKAVVTAALVSLPLIFLTGKLLDMWGRLKGGAFIFVTGAIGIAAAYQVTHPILLTLALIMAMYAATAFLQVANMITAELFPTELRSDAFGWCNNLLGRSSYVFSPLVITAVAEKSGWGNAMAPTAVFFLFAIVLLRFLPETAKRELEDSARV